MDDTTYLGFKAAVHADNEWIFGEAEDVPLREDLLCLIAQNQVLFADLLHGKSLPRFFMAYKINSTGRKWTEKITYQYTFSGHTVYKFNKPLANHNKQIDNILSFAGQ